ncbi:helix-turn-helix domain-containing protein [Streptomyces sp. NPDC088812]|uniref:helix-turn-helix domain-containing protein n=1 Tax=Streptomyces sp. NPDC088812 TaxID=3365905 RepID=UPI00380B2ADE
MEQLDWMARVGTRIAQEVRRHRLARGLSAQQLSDTCAKLGAQIPRTVISNIENGRRTNVSVAEVCVLATALRVPPVALIAPAGYVDEVEYLPGKSIDPVRVINWFSGETQIDERSTLDSMPDAEWALTIARDHRRLERQISTVYRSMHEDETLDPWRATPEEKEALRRHARVLELSLKALREEMVRRGLKLPKTYLQVDDLPVPERSGEEGAGYWRYKEGLMPF